MKTKKQPNYYKEIISALSDLKKDYPTYNMGRHLSTATSDYPDIWDLSDKELLYALTKYKAELDLNTQPDDINKIIEGAMHIENLFDEDDDTQEDY